MKPSLSVVIPTFRRDASLGRLLDALEMQTLKDMEIVVVDQNPPAFLSERLGDKLKRARVIHLDEANVSTARNVGFLASSGSHVLFIDDDLVPEPTFCLAALTRMSSCNDVRCMVPMVVTSTGSDVARASYQRKRVRSHAREESLWELDWTLSAAVFFERGCYEAAGGFDELLFKFAAAAEDQEVFLRMRARGLRLWVDADLSVFHDESTPGGCEMRSGDYWRTRRKCMRSWALRERTHSLLPGRLTPAALIRMSRSALLNRNLLQMSLDEARRNVMLLVEAIGESERFLVQHIGSYPGVRAVDHLARHRAASSTPETVGRENR